MRLCVDCYNDSKLLTPTAWNWPSRSLAHLHGERQVQLYKDEGIDTAFSAFVPTQNELHYRDPVSYAEMLSVLGQMELKSLGETLRNSVCFSLQLDGSVDTKQHDKNICQHDTTQKRIPLTSKQSLFAPMSQKKVGLLDC
jgi:hypothetical protein